MVQISRYISNLFKGGSSKNDDVIAPLPTEERSVSLSDPTNLLYFLGGGNTASSGVTVNNNTAMSLSPLWACVKLLSETLASLPFQVYKKDDKGTSVAYDHPLYNLIHSEPSPRYTSFQLRETAMVHLCLEGNFYALIIRDGSSRPIKFIILDPRQVEVLESDDDELYYRSQERNQTYSSSDIIHIPAMAYNGVKGVSPIKAHRDEIGLALGAVKYGSNFFKDGVHSNGYLSTDKNLNPDAATRLGQHFKDAYSGLEKVGRVPVLWDGMKFHQMTLSPKDAMYIDAQSFNVEVVSRIFKVPPHMIQHLQRSTNNNIEHQSLDFAKFTMLPWIKRFEAEFNRKCFRENEKSRYFTRFNLEGLLRADSKSRAEYYSKMITTGVMSRNEARRLESMNPIDGLDEMLVPLNMVDVSKIDQINSSKD